MRDDGPKIQLFRLASSRVLHTDTACIPEPYRKGVWRGPAGVRRWVMANPDLCRKCRKRMASEVWRG